MPDNQKSLSQTTLSDDMNPTNPLSQTTRYRPRDGNQDFGGLTREEWIDAWSKLPTWSLAWAAVRFDEFLESGNLVEVQNG